MKYPQLYEAGQKGYYFNYREFWKWISLALWHGAVAYFIPMYGMYGPIDSSGRTTDHWVVSSISFSIILHVVTYKLFVDTYFWARINILMAVITILIYYFVVILGSIPSLANLIQAEASGVFFILAPNPRFWIMIIVVPFICLLPDITIVTIKRMFFKKPSDIIAALEKTGQMEFKTRVVEVKQSRKMDNPIDISEWLKPENYSKDNINESADINSNSVSSSQGNVFNNSNGLMNMETNDPDKLLSNEKVVKKTNVYDGTTYGNDEEIELQNHRRKPRPADITITPLCNLNP